MRGGAADADDPVQKRRHRGGVGRGGGADQHGANSSAAVALQVKQGRQIAMVHPDVALRLNAAAWRAARRRCRRSRSIGRSFAPSPTAMASAGVRPRRAVISCSACTLASLPRIGSATCPVRVPFSTRQGVGAVFVKAQPRGDGSGEGGEAARHQRSMRAVRPHRRQQNRAAGHQGDAVGDDAGRSPPRAGLSAGRHVRARPPSNSSSPFIARAVMAATWAPTPGLISQLVDAFLLDHR